MNGEIQVELQEWMGSDAAIANAAWTSTYDKTRREDKYDDPDKITSLVQRLAKDGHSVPFESVVFRFWIRHPIFSDRQHCTHRLASHNGLSGRYRTLPTDWFQIPPDVLSILQMMGFQDNLCGVSIGFADKVYRRYNDLMESQFAFYSEVLSACKRAEHEHVISNGQYKRVREVIRGVIGTASMVERISTFNLRSFANYQKLRNSAHAQREIKIVAEKMLEQVEAKSICPVAIEALKAQGWVI